MSEKHFTEIEPAGDDVDYFKFRAKAGDILSAEVLTGQIDSTLGLFQIVGSGRDKEGILIALDDDGGEGVLSKIVFEIPEDGRYAIAVSTFPDFDFTGEGDTDPVFGQGRYVLSVAKE